jgi:hypothetical protein
MTLPSSVFKVAYRHAIRDAGFVVKLNPGGNGADDLLYSTFLGSYAGVGPTAIAVGRTGLIYVMGYSESPDFPTTPDAFDRSYNGPHYPDAVVTKLNLVGGGSSDLLYSTFLGGSDVDLVRGAVVDDDGAVHVTGRTDSSDFPTSPGAYDAAHNGSQDAFMAKLATGGGPTARTPVVVIPGYRSTICLPYSQSQDQCVRTPGPAESIYLPLKQAFEQAGYREGEDFYYCKYKWWHRSSETAAAYLRSCIDGALADNPGAESVHIITHSSGGNVARAYIQADGPSRVDRLLMIAPPNKGEVGIYWPWEGGGLSQEDRVSRVAYDLVLFLLSGGSEPLDQVLRFRLFHQSMPSLEELMPVEQPFLYDLSSEQVLDPARLVFANGFLPHLNANLDALFSDVSKVVVYAAGGHDTHEWIDVRSHDPNLDGERWLDGKPVRVPRFGDGDGTILLSRTGLPTGAS